MRRKWAISFKRTLACGMRLDIQAVVARTNSSTVCLRFVGVKRRRQATRHRGGEIPDGGVGMTVISRSPRAAVGAPL